MASRTLNWKRFWSLREGQVDLCDDGFLVDPESSSAGFSGSPAVPFGSIGNLPVLGLLGEPGIGKSTALAHERDLAKLSIEKAGDDLLWVDLRAYGTDALLHKRVFDSAKFKSWRKSNHKLHIFFDSLDECQLRIENISSLLVELFDELPVERLSVRIACRTADWPLVLESALYRLWGDRSVGIYELAPLRRKDVVQAAIATGIPSELFMAEIKRAAAAPLANRPITLKFLLNIFKSTQAFPQRQSELYLDGCTLLCEEKNQSRRDAKRFGRLSPTQRLAVASRLAAVIALCGRHAIWTGTHDGDMSTEDVLLDNITGGTEGPSGGGINVDSAAIRETIDTGLFSSRGARRFGFAHQTYLEFLAAHYLVAHRVPLNEILHLICATDGSGLVVPQLRETAAWLASLVPEVFQYILANDPETLVRTSVATAGEQDRAALVQQILQRYDSETLLDEHPVRFAGARLTYAGLATDLSPYIRDRSKGIIARRVAITLAEVCRQTILQDDLVAIALSEYEPHDVRVRAAFAIGRIGDSPAKAALKRLAIDNTVNDPDDELKGCALVAAWPSHMSALELFGALRPQKRSNVYGMYQQFLETDIAAQILPEDICTALDWAATHNGVDRETDRLGQIAAAIVAAAIDQFDLPGVSDRLASILPERARLFYRDESLIAKLRANSPAREKIFRVALDGIAPSRDYAFLLLTAGLVTSDDVSRLVSELTSDWSIEMQRMFAFLIERVLDPSDVDAFNDAALAARTNSIAADELRPRFAPILLDSAEAEAMKADHNRFFRSQERDAAPPSPTKLPPIDDLIASLDTGVVEIFADICLRIGVGTACGPPQTEDVLSAWKYIEPNVQPRVLEAAELYVKVRAPTEHSWLGSDRIPYAILTRYWALRLLKAHAPGVFDSLPDSVWRDWVSCVIGYSPPESDESYATILGTAYKRAPNEFLQAFAQLIDGENDRCGAVFSLDRLMQVWSTAMAEVLRARLAKETKLKPHAFRAVLRSLLKSGDRAARQLAKMWTGSASDQTGENNERATIAACQLLIHDSAIGWEAVWSVHEKYPAYARDVFLGLAQDHERGQLLARLREDQLAKLYIWLDQNAPAPRDDDEDGRVTPSKALYRFRQWVIAYLAGRGTPAACVEIRRLSELLVDEALKWHLKSAEELMRRNTRASFAPKELIALVSSSHAAADLLVNEGSVGDGKSEAVILAVPKIYKIESPPQQQEKRLTTANDLLGALAPKAVRRHPENIKIDDELRKIAEMHPKDHEEVFNYLNGRVKFPNAEPFRRAGGWSAGFQKDKAGARAWLSKAWSELNLPPFRRGPK